LGFERKVTNNYLIRIAAAAVMLSSTMAPACRHAAFHGFKLAFKCGGAAANTNLSLRAHFKAAEIAGMHKGKI
jgi:hypothetical protein